VFVHGLRRVNSKVWMSSGVKPELWPCWLADDIDKLGIWSVEHDSAPTRWRGHAMPLVDRANNILPLLLAEGRLKKGEMSFVVHSFGGLIFEQLLRTASERSTSEPNVAEFVNRIRRVIFLGTPHRGADLATWAGIGRLIFRPSSATQGLSRNDPNLNGLNQWYRRFAPENGIATLTLTEGRRTWYGLIVKPDSADPGLPSAPIPVDADHFGIAAPTSRRSEVYVHIRDFLNTPVPVSPRKIVVLDATLDAIANDAKQNTAALERIEQKLAASTVASATKPNIPSFLIDDETQKRVLRLRKGRMIPLPHLHEEVSMLIHDLTQGELADTSAAVRATALAWCARILIAKPDKSEAKLALQAAHNLAKTEEVIIAEAFAESYATDYQSALSILAPAKTPAGRAASFIIVGNGTTPIEALDWLRRASITLADLDADGKFFVLKKQLDARKWQDALATAKALQATDFEDAPGLLYLAGGAHLAQAVPEELITLVLWALPFDAAILPLADDASALNERRRARDFYLRSSAAAAALGAERAGYESSDRALWLGLRDPASRDTALAELEQSMRDPFHSLRRLPLAIQFGLKLDLKAVEEEIDRQDALSGGNSPDAALARFSLALTKKGPGEVAEYIGKHRQRLLKHLNPEFVTSVEIQTLALSGQVDKAETLSREQADPNQSQQEKDRIERIIAEARGADPIEARERQFKATDALTDLANLVEQLASKKDWGRLVPYARIYFERTRDLSACRVYAESLFETADFKGVVSLLQNQSDLVEQSNYLEALLAWALYRSGDVRESRKVLAALRAKRDDANDRLLAVNIGIASGDWTSLAVFVEQEWDKRDERNAEDLLRAGQLANQLGSARTKELIVAAANKASGDPQILAGCYGVATNAGWEDSETATWLERAAALSGEDGPVQRISLKEVLDLNPDWQKRETQTWEQLHSGQLPLFTAGHLLNRTLIDLYLMPALSNAETSDPRKRSLIYAYSGARHFISGTPPSAAIDPTALLTAGALDALDDMFGTFEKIVVPHGTLGWLFEEKQRIQFHQPSKIADALEIKRLIDGKALSKLETTASPDSDLTSEIGDELAAMFAEAEADFGEDRRQRLVVRSSPLHRVGSLMEEEANLGTHSKYVCSCIDVVDALVHQGQLTQAEEQHARTYLNLQEKPWPSPKTIEAGAVLYLDVLTISYLQHLRLLSKFQPAGFAAIIPASEVTEGSNFVRYENLATRATNVIESIRRHLSDGIAGGKVVLAPAIKDTDKRHGRIQHHPTFEVMEAVALADIVVIDDRYFNQHGNIQGPFGTKPVWTTYDLLTGGKYELAQKQETVTRMRRAGLSFVPVTIVELKALIDKASISEGELVESAELRAVRESIQMVRMSDGLQLPKEGVWLDNLNFTFSETLKSQWYLGMDEAKSVARSSWLLAQLDIRHWSHRYRVEGHPEVTEIRYRAQLLSLALLNTPVPQSIKHRYWEWFDKALLTDIKEEQRELYAAIVQQVRGLVVDVAQRGMGEASDGG
jgi:hypothetical protein